MQSCVSSMVVQNLVRKAGEVHRQLWLDICQRDLWRNPGSSSYRIELQDLFGSGQADRSVGIFRTAEDRSSMLVSSFAGVVFLLLATDKVEQTIMNITL